MVVIGSGVLGCGLIVLSVVLGPIRIYAERAAILEGLGWIDALKRGWRVLKDGFGPSMAAPICSANLLIAIVAALINSIVTTFSSATWTLAYRRMTGLLAQLDAEAASSG